MNEEPTIKQPNHYIVDAATGEITDTIQRGDKFSITRSAQLEYLENHIVNFNSGKSYVKLYDEVVPLLEKYLTLSEFKFAICLTPHISFEDCIIRRTMDRTSKIINIKELANLHEYNYDYAKKLVLSLKKKGIIGKHETGSILKSCTQKVNTIYTVNPYVYFRGSDIITPVHSFYSNSGWQQLLNQNNN